MISPVVEVDTPIEVEAAIQEVDGFLRRWGILDEPKLGADERRYYFQQLLYYYNLQPGPELVSWMVNEANDGDKVIDLILCQWMAAIIRGGMQIPEGMREYVAERMDLSDKKKNRKRGRRFGERDDTIAMAVWLATHRGFKATRNDATRDTDGCQSACSITAEALRRMGVKRLSEKAVQKIWEKPSWIRLLVGNAYAPEVSRAWLDATPTRWSKVRKLIDT